MATKLNNTHINKIISQCKEYKILDTYIILSHVSAEIDSNFLIQTYSNKKSDLINIVLKYSTNTSYKTIYNCIDTLERINILKFNTELNAWSLEDMHNMFKSKSEAINDTEKMSFKGYTHIRKFFLTESFFNMKAREKRLLIYICQLLDSKANKNYDSILVNLLKPNSTWLKILKTNCKYYAKNTIENMLAKYSTVFNDLTEEMRNNDIAPRSVSNFKFKFICNSTLLSKNNEEEMLQMVKLKNSKEYALVKEKVAFANITLSKQKIMHLVRAISTVKEWFLKERVVQLIINKYIAIQIHHSRENIYSLPKYAVAVVKAVIDEYNSIKNKYKVKLDDFSLIQHTSATVEEDIKLVLSML